MKRERLVLAYGEIPVLDRGRRWRQAPIEAIWRVARAWAEAQGKEHSVHGVQGVAPL